MASGIRRSVLRDLALPASQVVPHLSASGLRLPLVFLLTVLIGDLLFRKFEGNFAQELWILWILRSLSSRR